MTLLRHWLPVSNYSYGGGHFIGVNHTTQGFTGKNGMYDLQHYFAGDVGASSHVGIDNFHPGEIVEMVSRANSAWTQCNRNYDCIANEQCAMAEWSRDYWLNQCGVLLTNTAQWMREESDHFGIPLVKLTESQAQSGSSGWCNHSDLGGYGCGHEDCGPGYPWDVVIDMARGGAPSTPPQATEEDEPMYVLLAKSANPRSLHISLPGMHANMGLAVDASGSGRVEVRAAFHTGGNHWETISVYGDEGHNKVVVTPSKKFDAVRLDRIDNTDIDLSPNFGK